MFGPKKSKVPPLNPSAFNNSPVNKPRMLNGTGKSSTPSQETRSLRSYKVQSKEPTESNVPPAIAAMLQSPRMVPRDSAAKATHVMALSGLQSPRPLQSPAGGATRTVKKASGASARATQPPTMGAAAQTDGPGKKADAKGGAAKKAESAGVFRFQPPAASGSRKLKKNDVLSLNVGGTQFDTRVDTLTKASPFFKELFLSSDAMKIDLGQPVFLDLDPNAFQLILNFFRTQSVYAILECMGSYRVTTEGGKQFAFCKSCCTPLGSDLALCNLENKTQEDGTQVWTCVKCADPNRVVLSKLSGEEGKWDRENVLLFDYALRGFQNQSLAQCVVSQLRYLRVKKFSFLEMPRWELQLATPADNKQQQPRASNGSDAPQSSQPSSEQNSPTVASLAALHPPGATPSQLSRELGASAPILPPGATPTSTALQPSSWATSSSNEDSLLE